MNNAKIAPLSQGEVVIESLTDTRWYGWQKWQIVYRTTDSKITIHFN